MPVIQARYGALAAIVLSTVTFTAIHVIADISNPFYYLVIFEFAIFLSLVAIYSESLWITCGLRATWNWMDSNLFAVPVKDAAYSTSLYGDTINGNRDLYAFVNLAIIVVAIIVVLALFAIKGRKADDRQTCDEGARGSVR